MKRSVQKEVFLDSTTNLSTISKTTGLCPIFTRIPAVPDFWARGYAVSTVGFELEQIRKYIRDQKDADGLEGRF